MSKTITVYTLEELQTVNPEAFERVHKKWKDSIDYLPWSDEIMASLKAVIEACGGRLINYSIGAHSRSYVEVKVESELNACTPESFMERVLIPHGYAKDGKAYFPGLCAFTGYCADDDFLEAVWGNMQAGYSLRNALNSLARVASRLMEEDLEQHEGVESMLANWGEREYTLDGKPV